MPDKFPEAFDRFTKDVYVDRIKSFSQLKLMFSSWAGERWVNSLKQNDSLKNEAENLGLNEIPTRWIPVEREYNLSRKLQTWRFETVSVKGKAQQRYRDIKTGRFIKKP
jgi:hypothetical protein